MRHLELPDQVVLQRVAALVLDLELAVAGAGPGSFRFGGGRFGPFVADLDHGLGLPGRVVVGRVVLLGLDQLFERRSRFDVVVGLEQHVALERLLHLCLQLERGQLQQPDGLLQLRRHRQLLADP